MDANYKYLYEYFNDIKKDEKGHYIKKVVLEIQSYVEDIVIKDGIPHSKMRKRIVGGKDFDRLEELYDYRKYPVLMYRRDYSMCYRHGYYFPCVFYYFILLEENLNENN